MNPVTSALAAFKSGEGLKGELIRSGIGSLAIKITSTGLNLALAIVLARLLGAEEFGVYSFVFAIISILGNSRANGAAQPSCSRNSKGEVVPVSETGA